MYAPFGIERRNIGRGKHDSRSADGCAHRPRRNHSNADRVRCLISCASHNGSSWDQASGRRTTFRNAPADFR